MTALPALFLAALLAAVAAGPATAQGGPAPSVPDTKVPIPPLVMRYIAGTCAALSRGDTDRFERCVRGESGGYRATVEMLLDPRLGERAARAYRACAGTPRDLGTFHRTQARCIGRPLGLRWRFLRADRA